MIRYLLKRPIAVLMFFFALVVSGCILIGKVPVSLLPEIDIPQITVHISNPNTSPKELEATVVKPLRESFLRLNGLKDITAQTSANMATIQLFFSFGSKIDLSFIEVNEKIDQISSIFPKTMQRPEVVKYSVTDIPIMKLHVIPKNDFDLLKMSELVETTIKRRLEQLDGVSLIDINGLQKKVIDIIPDRMKLQAISQSEDVIFRALENANRNFGSLSIRDGQYRYFMKVDNNLRNLNELETLPVRLGNGNQVSLKQIATVELKPEDPLGFHLLNDRPGIVINIHKQSESKMNELVPLVHGVLKEFHKEYKDLDFFVTQDQTFLLNAGIDNLYQDIFIGGALTILLLFLFLGNWIAPTIMSLSIPVSLILTFIFFYVFKVTFNIISLSGLALGIGMLIDNSIVVIDNITRKNREGSDLLDSTVNGTNEVMAPVISQVLTTVAVYLPLLMLNGLTSSLISDQSIALTISLSVSLLVAFILSPLLFKILVSKRKTELKDDTRIYKYIENQYHRMISHILRFKLVYFLITLGIMPLGVAIAYFIPIAVLPKIEKKQSLMMIDWNQPVDVRENLFRVKSILSRIHIKNIVTESEVGEQQFLIQKEYSSVRTSNIFFSCETEPDKIHCDSIFAVSLKKFFPMATFRILDAPNAFTQLFDDQTPYFECRIKARADQGGGTENVRFLQKFLEGIPYTYMKGPGFQTDRSIVLHLNYEALSRYQMPKIAVMNSLQKMYGNLIVGDIASSNDVSTIRMKTSEDIQIDNYKNIHILSNKGIYYPLNMFVSANLAEEPTSIFSDGSGEYQSLLFERGVQNLEKVKSSIIGMANRWGYEVEFTGTYFDGKEQITQLVFVFFVVILLIYIILAVQYEDLLLPLIVMLTIPIGVTGSMALLYISGCTIDIMACVGFIVVLGLIVDDPTLKIEVLNRLDAQYRKRGIKRDEALLEQMIHEAGHICLKPLLMVSLTTSIAMVPVLFLGGLGNDLQKPLAYVVIGGLTIGTFFTTWFIPLAYWYLSMFRDWLKKEKD
jgi:multidrug efflux pump subunit AcrB